MLPRSFLNAHPVLSGPFLNNEIIITSQKVINNVSDATKLLIF